MRTNTSRPVRLQHALAAILLVFTFTTPVATAGSKVTSTGTGFFISEKGHVVTNAHVVAGCDIVRSSRGGSLRQISKDEASDLALYIASEKPEAIARLRGGRGARVGESVVAVGFPLSGLLSSDPIVTTGIISALSGLRNDRRTIQITAPVQPGNSGGPLLGENGSDVGVVVGKLNAMKVAEAIGDIPQNVNFAVSVATLQSFLTANRVPFLLDDSKVTKSPADIAAEATRYTVLLECLTITDDQAAVASAPPTEEIEDAIAAESIRLFDNICIDRFYDKSYFDNTIKTKAQRQLTRSEYSKLLPSNGISESFYDIPVMNGNGHIFVGRISYEDGAINCIVTSRIANERATAHWLQLHAVKYGSQKLITDTDNGAPLYFLNRDRQVSVMVQIANVGNGFVSFYSYGKVSAGSAIAQSAAPQQPPASQQKGRQRVPSNSRTLASIQVQPIAMQSGWITLKNKEVVDGFKIFRRYAYRGPSGGVPNLIMFMCSKDVAKAASHLSFVLPEDFQPASFPRDAWIPKINVRFLIDDRRSMLLSGEYLKGELFFDLNTDTSDDFDKILLGDKLALSFGEKNDLIQFQFTEKVDALLSEANSKFGGFGQFGAITSYSRSSVGDACLKYQQAQR